MVLEQKKGRLLVGHGIRNPTQEAAGSVTAVHEDGEDTGGSSVVASGNGGAATSATGGTKL